MKKTKVKIIVAVLCFGVMGFLHIYLRMQNVEKDYAINEIRSKNKKLSLVNKELKAKKAKMLSVKNLRSYAQKYKLEVPKREQIVVIQDNNEHIKKP